MPVVVDLQSLMKAMMLFMGNAVFDISRQEVLGITRVWQPISRVSKCHMRDYEV